MPRRGLPWSAIVLAGGAVLLIALIVLLALTRTRAPTSPVGPASGAFEQLPGTFSGSGAAQTDAFSLAGGDYLVDWTERTEIGCILAVDLRAAGGSGSHTVIPSDFQRLSTGNTVNVRNVAAGRWFFNVTSGCDSWTLTIRR